MTNLDLPDRVLSPVDDIKKESQNRQFGHFPRDDRRPEVTNRLRVSSLVVLNALIRLTDQAWHGVCFVPKSLRQDVQNHSPGDSQ